MKKYINKIVLLSVITLIPVLSFSQYCNNFHKKYCSKSKNKMFRFNGQSRSAIFSAGQTSELSVIVYANQDYRVSLCMDQNLGDKVEYKIYETKNVKVEKQVETTIEVEEEEDCVDCETKEETYTETIIVTEKQKQLLYNNAEDNYSNEIEFSVETTRRLTLEIIIPDGGQTNSKSKLSKSSEKGCVGILLEHMTTPKPGF
jgi:hypothetical protein